MRYLRRTDGQVIFNSYKELKAFADSVYKPAERGIKKYITPIDYINRTLRVLDAIEESSYNGVF